MSNSDSMDKKAAHAAYMREWRKKNDARLREEGKDPEVLARRRAAVYKHRAANPDKIRAAKAAYREKNAAHIKEWEKAYKAKNAAHIREVSAAYREKNAEARHQRVVEYRRANRELLNARSSEWARRNPEARRLIWQARRARKLERGGQLSKGLVQKLYKAQKGKCPCCHLPLGEKYHLDHIMPLALGGEHADENMQLLRDRCNMEKHAKHPVDFMQSRGFLL